VGVHVNTVATTIATYKKSTAGKIVAPDSLQYYNVWNFGQCDSRYGLKGFDFGG